MKIGDYEVERVIGKGTSSTVYRVYRQRQSHALKLFKTEEGGVKTEEGGGALKELFIKEFLLLKQHTHAHILAVRDFGFFEGSPYFVSELLRGRDFLQAMADKTLDELLSYLCQVLRALNHIHLLGLTHKDIKPENILLEKDRAVLIDFGFSALKAKETIVGTPGYIAPEIVSGQNYSAKGDMFSLGGVLKKVVSQRKDTPNYFIHFIDALTQKDPQKRPSALEAMLLLMPHVPERHLLQAWQADVIAYLKRPVFHDTGGHFAKITAEFTELKPRAYIIKGADGLGKARLLEELKTQCQIHNQDEANSIFLIDGQGESRPHTSLQAQGFVCEDIILKPWTPAAVEAIVQNIFPFPLEDKLLDDLTAAQGGNVEKILDCLTKILQQDPHHTHDGDLFSRQLRELLVTSTVKDGEKTPSSHNLLKLAQEALNQDRARHALAQIKGIDPHKLSDAQRSHYHRVCGEASLRLGELDDALKNFSLLLREKENKKILERVGLIYLRKGDWLQARRFFSQTLKNLRAAPDRMRVENYLAQVLWKEGNLTEAIKVFKKNWRNYEKNFSDQQRRAVSNFNLTGVYLQTRDHTACIAQAEREQAFYEQLGKTEAYVRVLYDLGEAYDQTGQASNAMKTWVAGLEQAQHITNPELLLRYNNALGNLSFRLQAYGEAAGFYEKALVLVTTQQDAAATSQILYNLSLTKERLGQTDQARSYRESSQKYVALIQDVQARQSMEDKVWRAKTPEGTVRTPQGESMSTVNYENIYRSLWHISEIIASEKNLNTLLTLVLKYALQLSGAERGAFILTEGQDLTVKCTLNAEKETMLQEISLSVAQQVIAQGEAVFTQNALVDERFATNRSVVVNAIHAIICLPIKSLGKTMGVLYLDHRAQAKFFAETDRQVLILYCQQVGIAIDNARLLEAYQKDNKVLSETVSELKEVKDRISKELSVFKRQGGFSELITQSEKMTQLFASLEPIVETKLSVVITGKSGTGKEILAQSIHKSSPRQHKPFIVANCGAIPENLVESELFGYKKGAFTGAIADKIGLFTAADGGSLFLDEVAELSLSAQVKLLRVVQEGEVVAVGDTRMRHVDVRLIAATHRDLKTMIVQGKFREDLYYRLCEFHAHIPPLHERVEDIPLLIDHFIKEYAREHKLEKQLYADPDLTAAFMQHNWPGNVRELRSVVRVGCALAKDFVLSKEIYPSSYDFLHAIRTSTAKAIAAPPSTYDPNLTFADYEQLVYVKAYKHHAYHARKTYESLGVSNVTFFKKKKLWDLKNANHRFLNHQFVYDPQKTLKEHLDTVLNQAFLYHKERSYRLTTQLKISPGFFYQWKKRTKV